MPPKPKPAAPSKKTEQKKKEKVIEDKTFGLKNKKGAKQQKFIQQVQKQVQQGGQPARKAKDNDPKKEKETKILEQKEMAQLFKPVQKVEKGADPKTILCAFFKQGQCTKGNKCKFSHDLSIERKAEKRSIYVDMRDDEPGTADPTIDLMSASDKNRPTTDLICKYFLDAVENSRYGWFWKCPNGETCIYKHALPPGYVLKKDMKKEKKEEISLEDLIERERAALASSQYTRITLETFLAWKKRKLKEKKDAAAKDEEKKRSDYKAGRHIGLSGREMFSFNPELAVGDQTEEGDEVFNSYSRDEDEEEEDDRYREIELDIIGEEAQEVDNSGTIATDDRLREAAQRLRQEKIALGQIVVNEDGTEREVTAEEAAAAAAASSAVDINESLFVDDDLDEIDQELEELDIDSDNS